MDSVELARSREVDVRVPTLSELDAPALAAWLAERHQPAYRGRQIEHALEKRCVQRFDELTDLPSKLRQEMERSFRLRSLEVRAHLHSDRDRSEKVLFALRDGSTVETVLIPGRGSSGRRRLTVCVSSQVGCPAACSFCATGLSGFGRNLAASEIVDQVAYFAHAAEQRGERINNVVFMGMGEPLLNTGAVRSAIASLTRPEALDLAARHVTVSTVGIVPQIRKFAVWAGQVNLAISLHAPNNELRSQLVPYNRHFPIEELLAAALQYAESTRRRVSFEYVLLRGVNDGLPLAVELATLLRPFGSAAHVNLIPWNPFREGRFVRSEGPDADAFAHALRREGINATIRISKGLDISAACGQLRERVEKPGV